MRETIDIAGFDVIGKLGSGGMSTVWKARQVSLDRMVAIKVLDSRLAADPANMKRFQAEAQIAARLKHQGIVHVHDARFDGGMYYFVMEYVSGYTIGDWVRRKGRLSEKDALLVAECVVTALDYAWQTAHIIHCDIKPDNIMIDSDGTIKVADLGLSRTITALSSASGLAKEVMGTPAYVSPEQAMGLPDLDCRADIYSLGATIYQLVTGKLLFEGREDQKIFELQVRESVEDPLETNPDLSKGVVFLLEKMLAKRKEDRHRDWDAVREDIKRVQRRHLIAEPLPPDVPSTIRRSPRRHAPTISYKPQRRLKELWLIPAVRIVVLSVAAVLLVAVTAAVTKWLRRPIPRAVPEVARNVVPPPNAPERPSASVPRDADADTRIAQQAFELARQWAVANPGRYDEAIERFRSMGSIAAGTKYGPLASQEIEKLVAAKQKECDGIIATLEVRTTDLLKRGKFLDAAGVYEGYTGRLASETDGRRKTIASDLRARHTKNEAESGVRAKEIEQKFIQTVEGAVSRLLEGNTVGAREFVAEARKRIGDAKKELELDGLLKVLDSACDIDERILESFKRQRGDDIRVALNAGPKLVTVGEVKDGKVNGQQKVQGMEAAVTVPISFLACDLAHQERKLRMGPENLPDVALAKGVEELQAGNWQNARDCFLKTHPLVAQGLVAAVDAEIGRRLEEEATGALLSVGQTLGISSGQYRRDVWIETIRRKVVTRATSGKALEAVRDFRRKYGSTACGRDSEPVLAEIERKARDAMRSRD